MMKRIFLCVVILMYVLTACTDNDSFTTSTSARLTFSEDTLQMDTVFSNVGSSTYAFKVYNQGNDGIRINNIRLKSGNQTGFRVNVDGSYLDTSIGATVTDLEVRKGDSLFVFVELTSPETGQLEPQRVEDDLLFILESGIEQHVHLTAYAWDAISLRDLTISRDTTICSEKPIVVYGSGITVDSSAVLTLSQTTLYFHDGAGLTVNGALYADHVVMRGDRLDYMFDYLPYDRVSGQWQGICFGASSTNNELSDCEIRNAINGIILCDSAAIDSTQYRLKMTRCVVHNSSYTGLLAYNSNVLLDHCQLTNSGGDCMALYGGLLTLDYCTLAQFYPFSADRGVAIRFNSYSQGLKLSVDHCIITGYESDQVMLEQNDTLQSLSYNFSDCLLRTPAVENDTVNFKNIQWETPQDSIQGVEHFRVIDEQNLYYDFHLDTLSTAQGKGCY